MIIRIRSTLKKRALDTRRLKRTLANSLRVLGLPDAEVNILFVGVHAMRTLNRKYRGKDRPTDVLSFSFREGAHVHIQPAVLGDIVVAVPIARKQARMQDHSLVQELERLLVHGLLHLAGYDHERSAQAAADMSKKERQLLNRSGTGR